jgi:hypothetical protein
MNARHANPFLWRIIVTTVFITFAAGVPLSTLPAAAQPSPTVTATNFYLTTNYVVSVVVTSPCPPCATNSPGPVNLKATALSPTNIQLRWHNQSTNQVNVQIYRRTNGKGRWWLVADVGGNVSNVVLTAPPNTACEFYALGLFPEDIASVTPSNSPPSDRILDDRVVPY